MRAVGYARVSTAEQGDSGLGLEHQRHMIQAYTAQRGWHLEAIHEDVTSGKNLRRPGLTAALASLKAKQVEGLVVAKIDRLSRSLMDFVTVMERSSKEGWALVALDLGVDTSTPTGEVVANIMASFSQFERRLISQRTKDALAVKRSQGHKLGRPRSLPEATVRRMQALRKEGKTLRAIAEILNQGGVATAQGGRQWHGNTVRQVLASRTT